MIVPRLIERKRDGGRLEPREIRELVLAYAEGRVPDYQVAALMMAGRGLGHTGGTLDKLEAIPGFRTALTLAEAKTQITRIGCAMLSQTDEIVPADRKMYALRDATATVEVIPLIAASITVSYTHLT